MSHSTSEIEQFISLLHKLLINLYDNALPKLPDGRQFSSDKVAYDLLKIITRNIEGILVLAKCDLRLLPSALIIARTLIETFARLLWLIAPENYLERDNRLVAYRNHEIKQLDQQIQHLKKQNLNTDDLTSLKATLEKDRQVLIERLSSSYSEIKQDLKNIHDILQSINFLHLYPEYSRLSQSTHSSHAVTWIYNRPLENSTFLGETIYPSDWSLPLGICWFVLGHSGQQFLNRFGGNCDDFITEDVKQKISDSLDKIKTI